MTKETINNLIDLIKIDLGEGLIACDIWKKGTGKSIGGYNSQPKATALFDEVTEFLDKTLIESGFDVLSEFYLLKLKNNSLVLILLFDRHILGMLMDGRKINLNYTFTSLISKIRETVSDMMI
jgi:hypothetical protein